METTTASSSLTFPAAAPSPRCDCPSRNLLAGLVMRLRALIADDEPLARRKIKALLGREPDAEVAGECGSGPEAARLIRELEPNLVFLDIEMPELDGLSVLKGLEGLGSRAAPAVIFVTAYDQYAVRAFDVKALDYLLKPIDRRRFRTALERAREHLRQSGEPGPTPLTRLLVRSGHRMQVLKVNDVDWVEAADNYVKASRGGPNPPLEGDAGRPEVAARSGAVSPNPSVRPWSTWSASSRCIRSSTAIR